MRHRAAQCAVILAHDAFLFSNHIDSSRPWHPDSINTMIERTRRPDKTKPPVYTFHLHQLRHYSITMQIGDGWDATAVASRHGNKDPNMTLRRYAHALKARDQLLAEQGGVRLRELAAPQQAEGQP